MKIYAKLEASENTNNATFDLEDLGLSQYEWEQMTEAERQEAVKGAVYDLNDQPYWTLGSFETY